MTQARTSATPAPLSRRDLQFLLYEVLGVEELLGRPRFAGGSRELFDEVLGLAEQIATERFAPHNRAGDTEEPHIGDDGRVVLTQEVEPALRAFAEAGLIGASMDEDLGGMQLPHVVTSAAYAWFQAANIGTSAYPMLTVGAANLIAALGSAEQRATWVPAMIEGRCSGTMCLSETQAGSSLADVTTRAERTGAADGAVRIFGSKMWISAGDHELTENIAHLVLARTPGGPAGVKGISLYLVPKFLLGPDGGIGERNDVVLAGVNHKMGWRGTVNTVLGFGEGTHRPGGEPGAVGYLVGEENRGLAAMFHMMNEARIGVGMGAAALGAVGYRKALAYARERPQGRPVAAKDPASPQVPLIEHADVRRMLLAQKAWVEGAFALVLYCGKLLDDQQTAPDPADREAAGLLLDVLTPITKSWPSQWGLAANDLAIQIHGGYGYTREYDVEQHYRDNRLNPIHEGTHGIQAMDLLGRKVVMQGGAGLGLLAQAITETVTRASADPEGEGARFAADLQAALDRLVQVTTQVWAPLDPELALANATAYLEAAGHIVVAWLWLQQWLAAAGEEGDFYEGKRQAAHYFFAYELPRTAPQLDLLAKLDRTALDMQDGWF